MDQLQQQLQRLNAEQRQWYDAAIARLGIESWFEKRVLAWMADSYGVRDPHNIPCSPYYLIPSREDSPLRASAFNLIERGILTVYVTYGDPDTVEYHLADSTLSTYPASAIAAVEP
ncbi:MAG: hypothetical protein AAGF24_12200 [Cyanobacteria bacterium P01_H01_bin.121]